jgi:hypothetical protein
LRARYFRDAQSHFRDGEKGDAMTTRSIKPVSGETSAYVRDRGLRPVIVTVVGGLIELRAKGPRTRECLDLAWCYETAVKARVARERAERKASKRRR